MESPEQKGDQGDRGKRGVQGVQGVQGLIGPAGETSEGSGVAGAQGVQGIQGIQGTQGEVGQRGPSSKPDDIPKWLIRMLKFLIPSYVILVISVSVAFYVGYQYSSNERGRICNAIVKVVNIQTNALINASNNTPQDPPLTPEQQQIRKLAIAAYKDEIDKGLGLCIQN